MTRQDCRDLAKGLGMTVRQFMETQTCRYFDNVALHIIKGACQFLDTKTNKCKVHEFKPKQCRTYPFWKSYLSSRDDWDAERYRCEGINSGRLISVDEITMRMRDRR